MPDEKDLGNRPVVDALIPLMDKMEKEERVADSAASELDKTARAAIAAGNYDRAIELRRAMIEIYRTARVRPYRIAEIQKLIDDCESLKKMKPRRRAPGKKGR